VDCLEQNEVVQERWEAAILGNKMLEEGFIQSKSRREREMERRIGEKQEEGMKEGEGRGRKGKGKGKEATMN
jgi:hypothetical protein